MAEFETHTFPDYDGTERMLLLHRLDAHTLIVLTGEWSSGTQLDGTVDTLTYRKRWRQLHVFEAGRHRRSLRRDHFHGR